MHQDIKYAQDLIKKNQLTEALNVYLSIDQINLTEKEQFTISSDVGYILYEMKHYLEAIDHLQQALTIEYPDNGRVNRMLGYANKEIHNYEIAVDYLVEAVHLLSDENEKQICKFELARLLTLAEDFELAENYFKDLLIYFKTANQEYYGSALYYLGQIQIMKKAVDIADEYFAELVKFENVNHKAHGYFGKLFIANFNKYPDQMLDLASKVLTLLPDFYEKETIAYFTVKSYQYLNDQPKYNAVLEELIRQYPDGKYQSEYDQLKNHVFKLTEI